MVRGTCRLRPASCSEAAASGHLSDHSQGTEHTFGRTHTKGGRGRGLRPGSQLAQWVGPRTPPSPLCYLLSRASGSPPVESSPRSHQGECPGSWFPALPAAVLRVFALGHGRPPCSISDSRPPASFRTSSLADRKSTRLNSSHTLASRMPSSA